VVVIALAFLRAPLAGELYSSDMTHGGPSFNPARVTHGFMWNRYAAGACKGSYLKRQTARGSGSRGGAAACEAAAGRDPRFQNER
jgi:hypothetical protein